MEEYRTRYERWLAADAVDEETKAELRAIAGDEKEIEDRFYRDLEFGTAGLRGVIAAGANRMNVYTVRHATQGLANYLLRKDPKSAEKGVAIAYDSRNKSDLFARETAAVFNGNGIKTYVFESLRPVPELSFTIRKLGCKSGVVITASHNPAKYNGYKAYWEDGCQVPPPMDGEIIDDVMKVDMFDGIRTMPRAEAEAKGLYVEIGEDLDAAYIAEIKSRLIDPETLAKCAGDLKVVYTPLHGTGNKPVRRILAECGFNQVHVVKEQELPDGNFPTVVLPNPEDPRALELGRKLAEQIDADLIVGTDPDADRVGIMVKTPEGYKTFTGNMTGMLLTNYVLEARKKTGRLPADGFIVKSIVTTEMVRPMAEEYGVELRNVLTGFKFIGEQILKSELTGKGTFLFGFEESYGYLCGTYARDKDAVSAAMLICEMAAICKSRGQSLNDYLESLYQKYGYYKEAVVSMAFEGIEGAAKMKAIMDGLRADPKTEIAGLKVLEIQDYQKGYLDYPKSNVLRFVLENNCWVCVRPSGTEPKIKFYFGSNGKTAEEADRLTEALKQEMTAGY
ncbi:MAG: phospho-sugar mutase [Firmicutes bacterium]|nr:phospho-sugar mutase [Bacillota bacterium]